MGTPTTTITRPDPHAPFVRDLSTACLLAIIQDLGKRNLRDQRNHEIRWSGERLKACRAELTSRKGKGW